MPILRAVLISETTNIHFKIDPVSQQLGFLLEGYIFVMLRLYILIVCFFFIALLRMPTPLQELSFLLQKDSRKFASSIIHKIKWQFSLICEIAQTAIIFNIYKIFEKSTDCEP